MVFKFNKIKSLEIINCILINVNLTRLVVSVHLQIWSGGGGGKQRSGSPMWEFN